MLIILLFIMLVFLFIVSDVYAGLSIVEELLDITDRAGGFWDMVWEWMKKVLLNCVACAAATAIAVIGNAVFFGDVDWWKVGSAALLSFIVCLLGHIAKLGTEQLVKRIRNAKH